MGDRLRKLKFWTLFAFFTLILAFDLALQLDSAFFYNKIPITHDMSWPVFSTFLGFHIPSDYFFLQVDIIRILQFLNLYAYFVISLSLIALLLLVYPGLKKLSFKTKGNSRENGKQQEVIVIFDRREIKR